MNNSVWTKEVNPIWSAVIILLAGLIGAWFGYQAGLSYYADKTAMYESIGNMAWTQRALAIQHRIGTGISTTTLPVTK